IGQLQFYTVILYNFCFYLNSISKMSHSLIFTGHRKHRTDQSIFFHLGIREAASLNKVHPGLFAPPDVIGMMNDPHLICLVILSFMFIYHNLTRLILLLPVLFYTLQLPTYKVHGELRREAWTKKDQLP